MESLVGLSCIIIISFSLKKFNPYFLISFAMPSIPIAYTYYSIKFYFQYKYVLLSLSNFYALFVSIFFNKQLGNTVFSINLSFLYTNVC